MRPARLVRVLGLDRFLPALAENDADAEALTPEELAALNVATPSTYGAAASRPSRRGAAGTAEGDKVWQLDVIGLIGIVGLVLMVLFTNGYTAFQYQGGTLLATVLTLMVIAAAVQPGGMVARALSLPPLVWLGKRSYGIYLWHYPLLLLMNPVANVAETPWWLMVVQALVVVGAAELSYRFVETPCRKGAIGALVRRVRAEGLRPAGVARIAHPTVKPLDLVRWLVRLACPPGGRVLDPFLGSGTTMLACRMENLECTGSEYDPVYLPLIARRLDEPAQSTLFA